MRVYTLRIYSRVREKPVCGNPIRRVSVILLTAGLLGRFALPRDPYGRIKHVHVSLLSTSVLLLGSRTLTRRLKKIGVG
jgi:hypothetical protein